jgi:hypothetical protein
MTAAKLALAAITATCAVSAVHFKLRHYLLACFRAADLVRAER